jgi:hypothetical protein
LTVQSYAIKDINESDNSFWPVFCFDTLRYGRLIADWSVENMNPDMISYGTPLDGNVSPRKKIKINI